MTNKSSRDLCVWMCERWGIGVADRQALWAGHPLEAKVAGRAPHRGPCFSHWLSNSGPHRLALWGQEERSTASDVEKEHLGYFSNRLQWNLSFTGNQYERFKKVMLIYGPTGTLIQICWIRVPVGVRQHQQTSAETAQSSGSTRPNPHIQLDFWKKNAKYSHPAKGHILGVKSFSAYELLLRQHH